MSKFHHAYNGIPTKRSDDDLFLKDGQPDPLDHLAPDTYSGTLKLTIETQTPLITAWRDPDGRLVVPSASGEKKGALTDDDAIIPASSLKGVLSSAYEEVTQSRLRVFDNDERRPQFRYTTDHPQRWQNKGIPRWKAGFLRATTGEAGTEWTIHLQQRALLPDSIDAEVDFTPTPAGVDDPLKSLRLCTPHLRPIASFEAFKQEQPNKTKEVAKQGTAEETKLIVSKIEDIDICTPKSPNSGTPQLIECKGYVVRLTTVPESGILTKNDRLINTKHNEYIFYIDKRPPRPKQIPLDKTSPFVATVLEAARIAIPYYRKNQRARHTLIDSAIRHIEKEFGSAQLKRALTPQNIYNFLLRKAKQEEAGIPVFVRRHSNGEWEIAFSQLSRSIAPGSLSPAAIAKHKNISPASSIREASPADRLLGFTTQEADQENTYALKGRLYLSSARLQPQDGQKSLQCAQGPSGWVPSILAGPKPWTAQPYLRSADGSGIFDTERSECFTDQHSLIRKTYPTHRFLLTQGRQPTFGRRVPPGKLSNSEVLIGSYINSGAVFESALRFEGLSAKELSILLWLLDPNKIVPKHQRTAGARGFFHLGLGKPLGFGTVCIRAEILTLVSSKTLAGSYRGLMSVLSFDKLTRCSNEQKSLDAEIASVNEALPDAMKEQSSLAVRAFVRSAYGWKEDEDEKLERDPVSYTPYTTSGKKSPILKYFKEYEQKRIKGEAQRFEFRMLTLEEDNDSSTTNPRSSSVTTTPAQQTTRSNAAQNTPSNPKPKGPVPPPGPNLYPGSRR